jgi:biotin carboxyl carrier protein
MRAKPQITALLSVVAAAVILAGCSGSPESTTTGSAMGSATENPGSASAGLIQAIHGQCDFGSKILHYLATGDNQGDPKLDTAFSQHVGVPLPQARAVADQAIERCDEALSKQEAAQASAAASSQTKASAVLADAQASAKAAQDKAERLLQEQKVCAPLGGTVQDGGDVSADLCVPSNKGQTTGEVPLSCTYATIPFQADGTLLAADIATFKQGYPGCFS